MYCGDVTTNVDHLHISLACQENLINKFLLYSYREFLE
jgi:hypothetical protein